MNSTGLKPLVKALATIKGLAIAPTVQGDAAIKLLSDQHEVLAGASGRDVARAFELWVKGGLSSVVPPSPVRDTGELSTRPNHSRPKA